MFFRIKNTPSGKVLQLVESFRDVEGRPRQKIVISLGDADMPEEIRPNVAKAVEKSLYDREELFEWDHDERTQKWIDTILRRVDIEGRWQPRQAAKDEADAEQRYVDGVDLSNVQHTKTVELGPVLVAWQVWNELKLDACLKELGFNEAQRMDAAAQVINRLVEPLSENALGPWVETTALSELFGLKIMRTARDRFYRISDKLLTSRDSIQRHIHRAQASIFSLDRTILLYDLTNTYFEGQAQDNPKAKRGNSKHKRNDCPQVVVGMVFDACGFELGHEVFEGNKNDGVSLPEMLERLGAVIDVPGEACDGVRPTVILDAGIATKENLKYLREHDMHYLVNDSRTGRGKYHAQFMEDARFVAVADRDNKSDVEIRIVDDSLQAGAQHVDRLLLCRSAGRRLKEEAMLSRAEERFVQALEKLRERVAKGRLIEKEKIDRTIGRLLAKHPRAARYYEVFAVSDGEDSKNRPRYAIGWKLKAQAHDTSEDLLGCYVLRTDRKDLDDREIWRLYMTLTRAEEGFRCLKSHLGLRPIYHQKSDRTDGHIFITVLAYHMLRFIGYRLEQAGEHRSWSTLKRILRTHSYTTMVIPTKDDTVYRIRKAGIPDAAQKAIYQKLGIDWKHLPVFQETAKKA